MSVTVTGLPALLQKFKDLGEQGNATAIAVVQSTADQIVLAAKQTAPADLGDIRQGIGKDGAGTMLATIFSQSTHSAYMEFGTGPQVSVPDDMVDMASQFKGAGNGSFADFILALTEWVRRHGLTGVYSVKTQKRTGGNVDEDRQAAWLIARAILKRGLTPRPFMYPSWLKYSTEMPDKLKTALTQLLNNA